MKRVLVTGSTGFIGRHVVAKLSSLGVDVQTASADAVIEPLPGVHHHRVDLLDPATPEKLLGELRPSHLLHLAWDATPGLYWTSPNNLRWMETSLRLFRSFAESGGQRIVGAGTCAEYDWNHGYCSEGVTPLNPATLYGQCKRALGEILVAFAGTARLSAAWGRIFFPYGPHEKRERLVPSVVTSLLRGEPAVCSVGTQARDFLYVEDAAQAFVSLLQADVHGPVNVASGRPVTVREVAQFIGREIGREELLRFERPLPQTEPPMLVADVRRLAAVTGVAGVSLEVGLRKTIDWWRDQLSDTQRR
jgi:nucleoside-diphosphate-sugar epimerase